MQDRLIPRSKQMSNLWNLSVPSRGVTASRLVHIYAMPCPNMASVGSENSFNNFLLKDSNLLNDLAQLRPAETVHLTRRLETAAKSLACISSSLDASKSDVCDYISQLIGCYVETSENTRISRGLEKVLEATGPSCLEQVQKTLGAELHRVLVQLCANARNLKKVSAMLEHSKLVQREVHQHVPLLLDQLGELFQRLLGSLPSALTREDGEKLYYTVKVCLQLFQQSSDLRQQGWKCLKLLISKDPDTVTSDRLTDPLAQVVNGIIAVLVKKNYAREVTLLAATAVAMVISTASHPQESAQGFFAVHAVLTDCASLHKMKNLHLRSTPADEAQNKRDNYTAEIAVLRSILLGSTQNVLCCQVRNHQTDSQLTVTGNAPSQAFLLHLFPLVCRLCDSGTEFQYLSFQLLSLWTQKLSSCLTSLTNCEDYVPLMVRDSVIISETLRRVWLSVDSPVDGVAEFVADTLKTLLEVWHAEVKSGRSDYTQLAEELSVKTVQVPWYARSRYKPLSLLLSYVDTDKLLEEKEDLQHELLECMGASFLAALSSDVYTAFMLSIRDKWGQDEQVERWQRLWLPTVMAGLTSPNSLLRNKVCAYWLTTTLKILPNMGPVIQHHLEDRLLSGGDHSEHSQLLFAWVAVCRNIRTLGQLDLSMLPEQLLMEAVYSDEEDVCSEALFLLSTTQKKAEPLGEVEMRLFQAALPYCLKVDSAPFRQKLVTSLRKVFVRIRDSCSTAIKRRLQAEFVDDSVRFMDWLYRLMMSNIVPGACFQRRRTCLDIVQAWFETVIFVEADGSKKGKAQGPTDVLMRYAQSKGLWDFFSFACRIGLLHCVVDGADEIQESAVHILSKYFPWTWNKDSLTAASDSSDLVNHLLHHGLSLCDSPRAYENHSGALLIRLVYEKFVREQGCRLQLQDSGSQESVHGQESGAVFGDKAGRSKACVSFFRDILLHRIKASLKASEVDVLTASKTSPMHGLFQALCECLRAEQSGHSLVDPEDWQSVLSHTVQLSISAITLVLHVLANGQTGNCPSFAQMGVALEQLVTDGAAEQEVTSSLSPEFQLLLSWCWLNLKESCTCLGTVTALGLERKKDGGFSLAVDVVEHIGDTFLRVLTLCRHRGAIEGCRNGFLQFCTSLMLSDDSALSAVPPNILHKVLCSLEKDEMTSSVTRRSAGLPIIVQTIAQAERRCKSSKLLQQTVSRLYTVASAPPSLQSSQTQDQAPVHALNVLKAVFSDASLSGELLTHLGRMTELVIRSFESSSWAVRNAATQLVSTLVTRMFGQRNKASLSCNMMTLQEWSAHFPELLAFVSQKLEESLGGKEDIITSVQPSLFLVLTLLASLGPAPQRSQAHGLTTSLRTTVLSAVSSPVLYLRELSATAVVALTPLDATDSCVAELLDRLGSGSSRSRSSNSVHGTLMCLEKLVKSRTVSHTVAEAIVRHVISNRGLISGTQQCPLLSAKCVDMLRQAVPKLPPTSPLKDQLVGMLVDAVFSVPLGDLQLGRGLLISTASSLIISLLESSSPPTNISLQQFTSDCLSSSDVEVRSAILDCLCHSETVLQGIVGKTLQKQLWQQLQGEADASCVVKICRLLTGYYLNKPSSSSDLDFDLSSCDLGAVRSRFDKLANVQSALFPVEAVFFSQLVRNAKDAGMQERLPSSLSAWSVRLTEFSQPCQNEDFRMAAAQGLALAGHSTLSFCAASLGQGAESVMASVVESCMVLFEETDSDIRRTVTRFVGQLDWKQKNPKISQMNSNLCSKMFLAYLCDEFGHSPSVMMLLINKLYTPGELHASLHKLSQARTHYLFEPEENTFFAEKIHQQLDIYNALSRLPVKTVSNHSASPPIPDLLQELRTAIPLLRSFTERKAVYSVCGEATVLAALVGLGMRLKYAAGLASRHQHSLLPDQEQLSAEVSMELTNLLQIPNIHPAVSTFLQPLLHQGVQPSLCNTVT